MNGQHPMMQGHQHQMQGKGSESDFIAPPVLNTNQIYWIWTSLLNCVSTIHAAKMIHRDLKPENFLLVPLKAFTDSAPVYLKAIKSRDFVFKDSLEQEGQEQAQNQLTASVSSAQFGRIVFMYKDDNAVVRSVEIQIKVCDFGLAGILERQEQMSKTLSHLASEKQMGTLSYMAPEMIRPSEETKDGITKKVGK